VSDKGIFDASNPIFIMRPGTSFDICSPMTFGFGPGAKIVGSDGKSNI